MSNPQVGELFVTAAQETRDDLEQTALRLFARATDLAAHASGALAGQLDELGERLSWWLADALGEVTTRAGDGLVHFGERLSGAPHPAIDLDSATAGHPATESRGD